MGRGPSQSLEECEPAHNGAEKRIILIIDLCCGKGRWQIDGEEVISLDSDPKVRPTIVADVRCLPFRPGIRPRLAHASPPCTYLSFARIRSKGYNEQMIAESLEIIAACFRAFIYLEAERWTLENPGSG